MENRVTRFLYDNSPPFFRNFSASIFGLVKKHTRYTGDFGYWLEFFSNNRLASHEELLAIQNKKLREQLRIASTEVPFYQSLFSKLSIDISEINSINDLHKLPILEKEQIRKAGWDLVNKRWPKNDIKSYYTSGSTGTPLMIPRPKYIEQMEYAFLQARHFGKELANQPYSSFTGVEVIPAKNSKPPFWVDNWANNQRVYSVFHISDKNLPYYYESLNKRYSKYILGHPSAIFHIANFLLKNNLKLDNPPDYIFCSSEELQPQYREAIEQAFGSEIRNRWGQSEFIGSITTRDCGHLHYDMDYSILEFETVETKDDGSIIAEIISTNVLDTVWPLIRYRTGDLVEYHPDDKCHKGYPGKVIRAIHGRTGSFFTLPNGTRISNISVIAKKCRDIKLMQVVQNEEGSIIVNVVPEQGYSRESEKVILESFRSKVGTDLRINIKLVNDIQKTKSGKYLYIVNNL
ncbi:MAG: phenylacetate--CoA ligase family protein [Gammaproteobacteria bacterium]|nr:MAG: phenylacetate--CoA ligase family protein [Gammaproteobacteria bacterium]